MTEHFGGEDSDVDWNTDDELEIDYFQLPPSSSHVHFMSETSFGADGATSSNSIQKRISDETVASFIDMRFSDDMIPRAIEETGGANSELILETIVKYSTKSKASSSKSKVIGYLIGMGFPKKLVIKAIQEYGDENVDELTNVIMSYAVVDKLQETEDKDINITDDDNLYSLSPDEEFIASFDRNGLFEAGGCYSYREMWRKSKRGRGSRLHLCCSDGTTVR